jgi:hypothetical protein
MKPKLKQLIALVIPLFFVAFVNAQTCKGNKVWTCRTCPGLYGTTYQECDCVDSNKVAAWLALPCTAPKHNNGGGGGNDYCDRHPCPCICAITHKGPAIKETSDGIYPNPLVNTTAIYVTLPEAEKVSLRIFELNGKLIATLTDSEMEAGEHKLEWDAANVGAGIYILRLQTAELTQTRKLFVVK